jgi:hypothetical protein
MVTFLKYSLMHLFNLQSYLRLEVVQSRWSFDLALMRCNHEVWDNYAHLTVISLGSESSLTDNAHLFVSTVVRSYGIVNVHFTNNGRHRL